MLTKESGLRTCYTDIHFHQLTAGELPEQQGLSPNPNRHPISG